MKKEEFLEFKDIYREACLKIINDNGTCMEISCEHCPFNPSNVYSGKDCFQKYCDIEIDPRECDPQLKKSCIEYLELFDKNFWEVK